MIDDKKQAWETAYTSGDNLLFYPHEEIIRFFSRYIRKKVSINNFLNVSENIDEERLLDLGCGIGRHIIFANEMGIDAYGIDLSQTAINFALKWASARDISEPTSKIIQGDVRELPWPDDFFQYAVSHGVLDSMPFEVATAACAELARVMKTGGLFYCDLISGDDSAHSREFSGEELITTEHERGTLQYYFNFATIESMIAQYFVIEDCNLIKRVDVLGGTFFSRYHLVLRKI